MATRPTRKQTAKRSSGPAEAAAAPRDRIIDAFMTLLGERDFFHIGLGDIAEAAEVSLAELRAAFPGKLAILAAFSKRIDEVVLAQGPAEGEGAKDRLFDILMRRLDALAPHKAALKSLAKSARRKPGLAAMLHGITGRSQRWMHAAAGIRRGGLPGAVALEGSVLVFAETLRVWLDDDDPDLARTMKTLDRMLSRGDRAIRVMDDVRGFLCRIGGARRGSAEQQVAG